MKDPVSAMVVVGWRERVMLPALGVGPLRAKLDTGARSCALHVDAQWRFVDGGRPWVGFRLETGVLRRRTFEAFAPIVDERVVTDSGGRAERRVFIRSLLRLAGREREVDINLADRRGRLFPMLVGRSALQPWFIVDPARSFVHRRRPLPAADAAADGQPLEDAANGRT